MREILRSDSVTIRWSFNQTIVIVVGALAPGVNGPTWTTLRFASVMLGVCLAVMLGLAFSSSDSWLVFHATFLVFKGQKVRLQRTLEKLKSLSSKANSNASVTVADSILVNYEDGLLKGHGTSEVNGEVVAMVCEIDKGVNKLVYMRSLRARYKPEVGDIIVGRVIEVAPKCWRVEINYSHDAVLMLSAMNLPDGIQRRHMNYQLRRLRAENAKAGDFPSHVQQKSNGSTQYNVYPPP
ncbi:hypothetical protein ACFX1S_036321 [Malus domestica]